MDSESIEVSATEHQREKHLVQIAWNDFPLEDKEWQGSASGGTEVESTMISFSTFWSLRPPKHLIHCNLGLLNTTIMIGIMMWERKHDGKHS